MNKETIEYLLQLGLSISEINQELNKEPGACLCDGTFFTPWEKLNDIFAISEDGVLTSLKPIVGSGRVILPPIVTAIGYPSFQNSRIEEVILPTALKTLGTVPFYNCTFLDNVVIPPSVKKIDKRSFFHCTELSNIDLGNVETIEESAFEQCFRLKNIIFPNTLKYLGKKAFSWSVFKSITFNTTFEDAKELFLKNNKEEIWNKLCENNKIKTIENIYEKDIER